jgi:hypothetical protein
MTGTYSFDFSIQDENIEQHFDVLDSQPSFRDLDLAEKSLNLLSGGVRRGSRYGE